MPLAVLPDYPGNREYLPECSSRWHYRIQETNRFIYGGIQEM
jgi:hypothetical protein